MAHFTKPDNNGFALYDGCGQNINKVANKYLVFEILRKGSQTYTNSQLKTQGRIYNWDRLPIVELYVIIELSTNSAMVYHARTAGKVSGVSLIYWMEAIVGPVFSF